MFRWFRKNAGVSGKAEDLKPSYPGIGPRTVIYAIGDIHGRSDLLASTFAAIDRDRQPIADRRWLEVYLGDYIDRGPDSAGVLRLLRQRRLSRPTRMLMGNHEAALLALLDGEMGEREWLEFGGVTTATSYGVDPRMVDALRDAMAAALSGDDLAFLRSLRPIYKYGPYVFVHAGVNPGVPLEDQSLDDLLWIRGKFLNYQGDFGYTVVHGHTPNEEPEFRSNRINIDTGAFATNRLTCLRIDKAGPRVLGA